MEPHHPDTSYSCFVRSLQGFSWAWILVISWSLPAPYNLDWMDWERSLCKPKASPSPQVPVNSWEKGTGTRIICNFSLSSNLGGRGLYLTCSLASHHFSDFSPSFSLSFPIRNKTNKTVPLFPVKQLPPLLPLSTLPSTLTSLSEPDIKAMAPGQFPPARNSGACCADNSLSFSLPIL